MAMNQHDGFRFGIEAEYMLVDSAEWQPLWYRGLSFAILNDLFESIPVDDLPPLDGLELEPPHKKLMPYVIEGYHVPDPGMNPIDLWPKGVEIRTPVCHSIDECLGCLKVLFDRMQSVLESVDFPSADSPPIPFRAFGNVSNSLCSVGNCQTLRAGT